MTAGSMPAPKAQRHQSSRSGSTFRWVKRLARAAAASDGLRLTSATAAISGRPILPSHAVAPGLGERVEVLGLLALLQVLLNGVGGQVGHGPLLGLGGSVEPGDQVLGNLGAVH